MPVYYYDNNSIDVLGDSNGQYTTKPSAVEPLVIKATEFTTSMTPEIESMVTAETEEEIVNEGQVERISKRKRILQFIKGD